MAVVIVKDSPKVIFSFLDPKMAVVIVKTVLK